MVGVSDVWTIEVESLWLRVEVVWPLEALVWFYFGIIHGIPHSHLEYGVGVIG